ncbi:acyltransferase family protein [Pseudomonas sp. NY15374]|uniref:acyltransferase family protein n=1 Tax=Pseudomonas sp. NY15374 TaxID=3400357 RepID=UPI003A848561
MTYSPLGQHSTHMKKTRINEIDLLRFFAAIAVVLFHYAFRGHAYDDLSVMSYPWLIPIAKYGYLGVHLFFMISGFVIFMSAMNTNLRSFAASRAARLYPAFWACCTITFLAILLIDDPRFTAQLPQYLINMSMLSDFISSAPIDGAYWSIFIEIRFYLLVAIVLLLRQMHNAEYIMFAWLIYAAKIAIFGGSGHLSTYLVAEYAALFIAGASFYMVWSKGVSTLRTATIASSSLLAIYQALKQAQVLTGVFKSEVSPIIVVSVIVCFFIVMAISATRKTGAIGRKNWSAIGALTYPLYLLHQVVGYLLFNLMFDKVNIHLLFWGVILVMLLLSYAINRFVEKPLSSRLRMALDPRRTIQPDTRHEKTAN